MCLGQRTFATSKTYAGPMPNDIRHIDLSHLDLCRTYAGPIPNDIRHIYLSQSWPMLDLCLTTSTYVWSHLPMSDNIYLCLTTFNLCRWPLRHRPQRDLPQPLLTSAGPMPNFKIWDQKVNVVKKNV
jgi:hypothetical protein